MPRQLIPRKLLFDNPVAIGGQISPDGQWLTWLAPFEGVMNIWISPTDDPKSAEPLTRTKGRPIHWHLWVPGNEYVAFTNDENGDERDHIYSVSIKTKELRDLTPIKGVTARMDLVSRLKPGKLAVLLNDRDERFHDVHIVDLATAKRTLVFENTAGYEHIGSDWTLTPRFAKSPTPDGGGRLWRLDGDKPEPMFDVSYTDNLMTSPMCFDATGKRLFGMSSIGRDTSALVAYDWATGAETVIAQHPRLRFRRLLH